MITLSTVFLGLVSTIATEVLTWVNKKLSGTVLVGKGAWLLSAIIAILIASVKVLHSGLPTNWQVFSTECATIWALSQIYFTFVIQYLNLDVPSTPSA